MPEAEDRNDVIWNEFAEVCEAASADEDDVMSAIVLDWLRKTHAPGDGGKLMHQLSLFRRGELDVPKWKHISAAPVAVFAQEVPVGTAPDKRLEKDRANSRK